jgi:hypothetical protein
VRGGERDRVLRAVEGGVDPEVVPAELDFPGGGVGGVPEEGDVVLAQESSVLVLFWARNSSPPMMPVTVA